MRETPVTGGVTLPCCWWDRAPWLPGGVSKLCCSCPLCIELSVLLLRVVCVWSGCFLSEMGYSVSSVAGWDLQTWCCCQVRICFKDPVILLDHLSLFPLAGWSCCTPSGVFQTFLCLPFSFKYSFLRKNKHGSNSCGAACVTEETKKTTSVLHPRVAWLLKCVLQMNVCFTNK